MHRGLVTIPLGAQSSSCGWTGGGGGGGSFGGSVEERVLGAAAVMELGGVFAWATAWSRTLSIKGGRSTGKNRSSAKNRSGMLTGQSGDGAIVQVPSSIIQEEVVLQ